MLSAFSLIALLPALVHAYSYVEINPNGDITQCLTVVGATPADGSLLSITPCAFTDPMQLWDINPGNNDATFKLHGTNFCVDAGDNPHDLVQAKIWTCYEGLPQQTWYYTDDDRIAITGGTQCLDSGGAGGSPETYTCTTGNTNQIWTIGSTPCDPSECYLDNEWWFQSPDNTCITPITLPYGGNTPATVGTPVGVVGCPYRGAHIWAMNDTGVGSAVVDPHSGLCLDAGIGPHNGGSLKLWTCYPGLAQQTWVFTADGHLALYDGSQCADIQAGSNNFTDTNPLSGGTVVPAGVLQTWQCTTGDVNQAWQRDEAVGQLN